MTSVLNHSAKIARRLLPVLLIVVGVGGLVSGVGTELASEWLAMGREAGPVAFVMLGTLAMCLFVPKTFVSIAAGSVFGLMVGGSTLAATAVVSAWVNYHLGKWSLGGGSDGSESKNDGSSPGSTLEVESEASWREGLRVIGSTARDANLGMHLLVRLSPIPTTIISYSMGAAGARQVPYLAAALLAAGPQLLWVHCGAMATETMSSVAESGVAGVADSSLTRWLGLATSVVAAVLLSVWVPRHIWQQRTQELAGKGLVAEDLAAAGQDV
ncbi:putative DedA family protein [Rhodopirellula islandica]|uniref:TVP38/TMEM64 family membrane protein n=1 Tax=Rhodopirellula islandica TaxID=595434 RepID=A0A0J1BD63_RHOIS|nr:VTT domain-containing protein [Rhodopirellula islandica]KLU04530.1 putative DedA family protein [Rhodopirellula islandica]